MSQKNTAKVFQKGKYVAELNNDNFPASAASNKCICKRKEKRNIVVGFLEASFCGFLIIVFLFSGL
jgi:hypothetical protein